MSTSELVPALADSLDGYWSSKRSGAKAPKVVAVDGAASSACDGPDDGGVLSDAAVYCPSDDTIYYDRHALVRAATDLGDFSAGVMLAAAYSSAVQAREGHDVADASGRAAATCLDGRVHGVAPAGGSAVHERRRVAVTRRPRRGHRHAGAPRHVGRHPRHRLLPRRRLPHRLLQGRQHVQQALTQSAWDSRG